MAIGAVINATWDLAGRRAGKPVWRLIADMTPEQIVDLIDFRYITDALSRDEAWSILRAAEPGRAERISTLVGNGYPAYTTSPGWLGYSDEKLALLAVEAVEQGFRTIKIKVGSNADDVCADVESRARRWGRRLAWQSTPTSAGMLVR